MFTKKRLFEILPYIIIAAAVAVFFGKTLFPPKGFILYGGDLNDQFFYWKSFYAENIKQGNIPFWNPYSFSGTPFLAHPSVAAFYPFNIIFILLPLNTAFSVYLFVHLVLAGILMYSLCRKYVDKLAALVSGLVFCLSGLMAARIYSGHVDIISTFIWIPGVFWSITNALESKKKQYFAISILFLTLQILAGYQAVVIFTIELIFIYHAVCWLFDYYHQRSTTDILRKFLTLIIITLISYGISAVQLLPTIEFVKNSIRATGLPYESLTWGSYTKDLFLTFVSPFKYGNPFPDNYTYNGPGPNFFEISYFAGIIPLLLFLAYTIYQLVLMIRKKKADKMFIGLIAAFIFFLLMAMGNNAPLHKFLYQTIPVYRLFRFPSQHLVIVVFIISLMAGLSLKLVKNIPFKLILLLLIIYELVSYNKQFIRLSKIPTDTFDHNLTSILEQDKELVRLLPDYSVVSKVRQSWDFESSLLYKIQSTSGYNPILLGDYYHFIDLLNKKYTSSITQYNVEIPPPDPSSKDIDFLNVKYLLADKNYDSVKDKSLDKYILREEGENYRLYENKDYLPRFFINCSEKDIQKVDVIDYQLNSIRLKTNSVCDGILSSSEVYYPGWKASVDGREVQISKSNTAFRSIFLPKGNHTVVFYYQPTIYYIGGIISLVSLITTVWIYKKNYEN